MVSFPEGLQQYRKEDEEERRGGGELRTEASEGENGSWRRFKGD